MLKPADKNPDLTWRVETAKSGRAKCRACDAVIEDECFRLGEPHLYEEHVAYHWHHAKCVAPKLRIPSEKMEGFRLLEPDEKIRLQKLLQG